MTDSLRPELSALYERLALTQDKNRAGAASKRHAKGYRTARENLEDLVDPDSFQEYGQLAVAAQRSRRSKEDLQSNTPADGIITGICTINSALVGQQASQAAVIINDYSVLAGTQGYYHHKKLDRICELVQSLNIPAVMYTEGGGGRPGDTDILTGVSGLNVPSFLIWASLQGVVPRIAINNGYCFAGNAALFGSADFRIATQSSWIGMAGPAMIEGGGLGRFKADQIGPIDVQEKNGVVDIVAQDEKEATAIAKNLLAYFQGDIRQWRAKDQSGLRNVLPSDRRWSYSVREIIETIADEGSFIELRRIYGRSVITGFVRIKGKPMALLANDCQQLGGAIDTDASQKMTRFIRLVGAFNMPMLSLVDTPGFMVGPDSEAEAAVLHMPDVFSAGASVDVPFIAITLRKAYGLGAMAMVGGSFARPVYAASWPTGEFGAMGLEGAVKLGYSKELEAIEDPDQRELRFNELLMQMYETGKATETASFLEIDAVIDPADTREVILRALLAT